VGTVHALHEHTLLLTGGIDGQPMFRQQEMTTYSVHDVCHSFGLYVVGDCRLQTFTWLQSCHSELFRTAAVCCDLCEHDSLQRTSRRACDQSTVQIQFITSMASSYVLYDEADGLCMLCVKVHHLHLQVSQELIRMAILWHEMWHEALEEASRQYFGESNVEAMLSTLMPLHEMMQANGGITLKEIAFVKVSLSSEWNS